jgi:protein-L-isoaspartate(D-aspartate) O-methyltransferase
MGSVTLMKPSDWETQRQTMVAQQLESRGLIDQRVLSAMRILPRHIFIPEEARSRAYEDRALPIGQKQTISQPFMVAVTLQALRLDGSDKVLEIGTGTGYQAALLGMLSREVHTIELVPELAAQARLNLAALGLHNVHVHTMDGSEGLAAEAPFDAIVVAAAAPDVPEALINQLAPNGRLAIPIGSRTEQRLTLLEKRDSQIVRSTLNACAFVPLLGMRGWPAA